MTAHSTTAGQTLPGGAAGDMAGLPDHSGNPQDESKQLFGTPPPEIGALVSAESTLKAGKAPQPLLFRIAKAATLAGAIILVIFWLSEQSYPPERETWHDLAYILAAVAFVCVMLFTGFKAVCSYIGERGVVRYTLKGSLEAAPKEDLLLFSNAAELYAGQIRQFVNGVYTGTNYNYYWIGANGQTIYRLKGTYREKNKRAKPGDPWHFANAAEISWTMFYFSYLDEVLTAEGSIPFRVDKRRLIRVGPGFLEFHFDAEPVRVTQAEIASVSLAQGQFSFKHKDAKWYSRAGKFSFSYSKIANARVFLVALDKLMGYRWG